MGNKDFLLGTATRKVFKRKTSLEIQTFCINYGVANMIGLNHKKRKELKEKFKQMKGLSPVFEFSYNFIKNNPRGYLAAYTHYLEEIIIETTADLKKIKKLLKSNNHAKQFAKREK